MAAKKITVKYQVYEVENLTELNQNKDDLIKVLDEKIMTLRTSEKDQLHLKNEKILDQKVSGFNLKLVDFKNDEEEANKVTLKTVNVNYKL